MPLTTIVDKITEASEKGHYAAAIFVDLKKAFDTLDHSILITKLEHYGIRGIPLKLMISYLTDRQQCVTYNGITSNYLNITTGVPQGSVLGPLLFLIYINDIARVSKLFSIFLFADDTTILDTDKDLPILVTRLNCELLVLDKWFKANKLSVNTEKTKYIIFGEDRRHTPKITTEILINGQILEKVSSIKFLGVDIDSNLGWKTHINRIQNKVASVIGILSKIRHKISKAAALLIYDALINSHLNYCSLVWATGYKSSLHRLYILQKRALKICLKVNKFTDTNTLFVTANRPSINEIYTIQLSTFVYSCLANILPSHYDSYYRPVTSVHSHGVRSKSKLYSLPAKKTLVSFHLELRGFNCGICYRKKSNSRPHYVFLRRVSRNLLGNNF